MRKINLLDGDVAYLRHAFPVRDLVYWELGNFCTYKCSYCSPGFNSGSNPYQSTQIIQDTLKKLPPVLVIFSGGEPTFHPDFEKIVLEKPDHVVAGVVTNASRPYAFWERIISNLDLVILSYHNEFAQFDRFFKVAELVFKTHKRGGRVNVIMLPWKWDECVSVYNMVVEAGIPVTAKQLLKSFGNGCEGSVIQYTPEQINWLADASYPPHSGSTLIKIYNRNNEVIYNTSATELFVQGQTNFTGWKCHIPEQYLVIGSDGKAYNTSCDQKQIVGDIYNGFTFPNPPVICRTPICWCFSDIAGRKSSPNYNGPIPNEKLS